MDSECSLPRRRLRTGRLWAATALRKISPLFIALTLIASAYGGSLGQFEDHSDVGSPKLAGGATYNGVSQEYSITASGVNMWANRDEFHGIWRRLAGDFILQARVEFVGQGADPHRKMGWIVRSALETDSPYADAAIHGDGLTSLQFRRTQGAITDQVRSTVTAPDFIQFERKGSTYRLSAARFGEPLVSCDASNLALGEAVYVGLFLCSHNPEVLETAVFRDVRIIRPAAPDFVPYRDYIGSYLEILDVSSGQRQIVFSSAQPVEAPNWTRDGGALIYNGSGRGEKRGHLYRFDLATRRESNLPTDFANRNNNDHVLSFDGTQLGISHHSTNGGGRSVVLTVPVQGGIPKQITPEGPSYLHGWSPDGKFLVYTGERNHEFDIYQSSSSGGGETRLTSAPGLDDGPEYTPDGKYIYFNSSRSGTMQIWRMKPDGSDQEAVTHDEYNNWFPHISPDGKSIVFVSFSREVSPTDHPYYKQIYLRLMPIDVNTPKIIAYVYGGQGTLNVPSWSPDSRMIAFVSNTKFD